MFTVTVSSLIFDLIGKADGYGPWSLRRRRRLKHVGPVSQRRSYFVRASLSARRHYSIHLHLDDVLSMSP